MRTLHECQAEVFRRSEERIRARRRAARALLVCLPLILCITAFSLFVLPDLAALPGEPGSKNDSASPPPAVCRIDISEADQVTSVTDQARIRAITNALTELNVSPDAPSGVSDIPEASGGCTIVLVSEDSSQTAYLLTRQSLTNRDTGHTVNLTQTQAAELTALLGLDAS
jgi:hypothetical protein